MRIKNEITPLNARQPASSPAASSACHGPPGPRTPRSPRLSQTHGQSYQPSAEWREPALQHAPCASPDLQEQDPSSSSSLSPTPSPHQVRQPVRQGNRHLHEIFLTPSRKRGSALGGLASPTPSPGGDFTSRVRSRALSNLLHKGRRSSIVIYCFDAWRMLMYCRIQHDLGKEETLRQQLQFVRDISAYQQQLEVMSLQQKKERELFMQKQNQEREVFIQMISMLSTSCAQLQAQTLRDQTASAANLMPFAPAAQDPGGCTPDFSGLLAALTGGTVSGLAAGHAPSACAALQASAGSSPLRVADGAGGEDDGDDEVTIRGSPFCSAAAAASTDR